MKSASEVWRFDRFELDRARYELRRAGSPISLSRQPMELLILLLQRQGTLVTREEITDRLWGHDFSAQTDRSINTAISKIRLALRDDSDRPLYVETVIGKGYRFIGKAERILPEPQLPGPQLIAGEAREEAKVVPFEQPAAKPPKGVIKFRWPAGLGAFVLLLGIAATVVLTKRTPGTDETSRVTLKPLTSGFGFDAHPRISVDGQKVVYSGGDRTGGGRHIYVKRIGARVPEQLTFGKAHDISPVWSSDGQSVAFLRTDDDVHVRVVTIASAGGPEHFAAELLKFRFDDNYIAPLDWSADGEYFILSGGRKDGEANHLILIAADNGRLRDLTAPVSGREDVSPRFSPDGRAVVFVRGTQAGAGSVCILPLTPSKEPAGEVIVKTPGGYHRDPAWTPDGKEIIYVNGYQDAALLWKVRVDGSTPPSRLPFGEPGSILPSVAGKSSGGWSVCYMRRQRNGQIIGRNLDSSHQRFAVNGSTAVDNQPKFSPDGKSIALRSTRSGSWELWLDTGGSEPVQMTNFGGTKVGGMDWSPDGKRLVFDVLPPGEKSLLYTLTVGQNDTHPLVDGNATYSHPKWSRDGKWIYFVSDQSGTNQIWRVPAEGGKPLQVTRDRGDGPIGESPDGKYIYYYMNQPAVRRARLDGSEVTEVVKGMQAHGNIAVRDRGIYFEGPGQGGIPTLFVYPWNAKQAQVLFQEPEGIPNGYGIDVSYDERRILYTVETFRASLMLAEHVR